MFIKIISGDIIETTYVAVVDGYIQFTQKNKNVSYQIPQNKVVCISDIYPGKRSVPEYYIVECPNCRHPYSFDEVPPFCMECGHSPIG